MTRASTAIDTDRFSEAMRQRGIDLDKRRILVTNFDGSKQAQDLTEPANCGGYGRIHHFTEVTSPGWPTNPLPITPAARALGHQASPTSTKAQVFQNAVCNWRCWYCFVDFELLAGNPKRAAWFSAEELLDMYLAEPERPAVIDLSGGQPDLVPEWIDWTMSALHERELDKSAYLWSDDNLSNDYFFTKLSPASRKRIDAYRNYGKVCCFKGFDDLSFAFNTGASSSLFDRQFELMSRLLGETGIDLYCYATFTTPHTDGVAQAISVFVDRLQALDENLPLRTVPLQIGVFSPVTIRLGSEHRRALLAQEEAAAAWQAEIAKRYSKAERAVPIVDVALRG